jgi:hypothetical protein
MVEFGLCAVTGFPVVGVVYNDLCGELNPEMKIGECFPTN